MEKQTVIVLRTPVENNPKTQAWSEVPLKEPTLLQVQQFFDEQTAKGALSGMALLISLLSGIPLEVVKKLPFTEYKQAETWLLGFLTDSPDTGERA